MLVDSHAHLNFGELLSDIDGVMARAKSAGVEKIINIGTNLEDSKVAIGLTQKFDNLFATVGMHPNDPPSPEASEGQAIENVDWEKFERLAKQPKVVGIGECGLDFSRLLTADDRLQQAEKERQSKLFQKQIEIAKKLDLPLTIHIRDAQEDLMKMDLTGARGVFHCFSGDQKYLEYVLDLGYFVSFAGNVTFGNAKSLRELVKLVPMDKLLVETDCPFLSPEPLRGSRNEPANVKITATVLAEIKRITFDQLAIATTANAEKLFNVL